MKGQGGIAIVNSTKTPCGSNHIIKKSYRYEKIKYNILWTNIVINMKKKYNILWTNIVINMKNNKVGIHTARNSWFSSIITIRLPVSSPPLTVAT